MELSENLKKELLEKLLKPALEAKEKAYAPYSKFRVGAALLTSDGSVYTGCNVENASYGLTVCAERVAAFKAVCDGKKVFKAILIVSDSDSTTPPCGACRQVLAEFAGEDMIIISVDKVGNARFYSLSELLPWAFKFRVS